MLNKYTPLLTRCFFASQLPLLLALCGLLFSTTAMAQNDDGVDLFSNLSFDGLNLGQSNDEPSRWSAQYFADADGNGRVEITASLSAPWHVYSTTQKDGGPTRTKLTISKPPSVTLEGPWVPDHEPHRSISSDYDGLEVEEHEGVVTWSAPVRVPAQFEDEITVKVQGLICRSGDASGRCMPVRETLVADYAGALDAAGRDAGPAVTDKSAVAFAQIPAAASGNAPAPAKTAAASNSSALSGSVPEIEGEPFRDKGYVVEWRGMASPGVVPPGGTTTLMFSATPDRGFHVYQSVTDDTESSTNFVITKKSGLLVGGPVANKPIITQTILAGLPPSKYYPGEVIWQLPIKVPAGIQPGKHEIEGLIAYQACTESSCQRPTALRFTVQIEVGEDAGGPNPVQFASAKSRTVLDAAAATNWVDKISLSAAAAGSDAAASASEGGSTDATVVVSGDQIDGGQPPVASLSVMLGLAFLGGLILNVMPCVLPVVGLKIIGFVNQAGEDRQRVLVLNIVYVLGIMSVFALLAIAAALTKFGWGEQFTYFPVKYGLTILMFALALSYLGVWEIPAPGMAGGKKSMELQSREGLLGAFSKGIFATILSTPCSGPLLGYILGATLSLSPLETIAIFLTVGLGMSSPYLLIGVSPRLVSWLPKPGGWMETVKQLMAFLFLGTVAFFFSQFNEVQKLPVFVSLIAVWFGCWIIGQVPHWADVRKRLLAWTGGITSATLISLGAFHYLEPHDALAWQDYNESRLQSLQREGRTVLVDFGAKWCLTCKLNYKVAINTAATRAVLDELDGVALYADWTDYSEEIKSKLEELNSRSIPLLAIYPGNRPDDPIILRDVVTQQTVIDALRAAGASVDASQVDQAANGRRPTMSVAASE